jgi:16S rRNA (cytosine1402-N4)-methyltransferase
MLSQAIPSTAGRPEAPIGRGVERRAPDRARRRHRIGAQTGGPEERAAGPFLGGEEAMARRASPMDAAGAAARHVPVLLAEVLDALAAERGGVFVDGTFGAGGYTQGILAAHPENRVVAIDRDPDAVAAGLSLAAAAGGRLALVPARFGDLDRVAGDAGFADGVDGIVLDVGVSSMQLDEAARGFSFRHDGPLDMRMEREGESAADLVNGASEATLADVFFHFGEERRARAVARAVVERRRKGRIETTGELADLVAGLVRAEPGGIHPATRVFQALRIAVNDELGELVRALHAAERALSPGGRLAVVTFHSLEDRIVKQFLAARSGRTPGGSRHLPKAEAARPSFSLVTRGPVGPSEAEAGRNPRARSAKLRAAERTGAPPQGTLAAVEALAALPAQPGRTGKGGR